MIMTREHESHEDVDIVDGRGDKRHVCFDLEFVVVSDGYYGADADGNRGVSTKWVEDMSVDNLEVWDETDEDWYELGNYHPDEQAIIMEGVDRWVDSYSPVLD